MTRNISSSPYLSRVFFTNRFPIAMETNTSISFKRFSRHACIPLFHLFTLPLPLLMAASRFVIRRMQPLSLSLTLVAIVVNVFSFLRMRTTSRYSSSRSPSRLMATLLIEYFSIQYETPWITSAHSVMRKTRPSTVVLTRIRICFLKPVGILHFIQDRM